MKDGVLSEVRNRTKNDASLTDDVSRSNYEETTYFTISKHEKIVQNVYKSTLDYWSAI